MNQNKIGSYRHWFFNKIVPWIHKNRVPNYAYVFYNVTTYTYLLTPSSNIRVVLRLLVGFAKTAAVPLKDLFTHVGIFSTFRSASVFAASLHKDGYLDMSALNYQSIDSEELEAIRRSEARKCFSPTEAAEIEEDSSSTRLYIFNSDKRFISSVCLDELAYDAYFVGRQTIPKYDDVQINALESEIAALDISEREKDSLLNELRSEEISCNSRIVFHCTDVLFQNPIRYFPFATRVYVWESESKKVRKGGAFALVPTNMRLGRIQSDCVRQGGSVIGSNHCQTDFSDPIYRIVPIPTSLTRNIPYMGNELRELFTPKIDVGNLNLPGLFEDH